MYLLPHITPELIVLKYSVECGAYLQSEADHDQFTPASRFRPGLWTRLKATAIFSSTKWALRSTHPSRRN